MTPAEKFEMLTPENKELVINQINALLEKQ